MVKTMDEADRKVLAHIGRYRVATRESLAELLASQAAADKRIGRMVEQGLVAAVRGLPRRRVVYQLTLKGTNAAGLSPARAKRLGMQAIIKHLGLLLLCSNPAQRCLRAETEELSLATQNEFPAAAYCMLHSKQGVAIAIAYVPAPQTPVRTVVRRIRSLGRLIRKSPVFDRLRAARRIGVLVVTDSTARRVAVSHAIRRPEPGGGAPVIKRTRVWVRCVPELGRCLGLSSDASEPFGPPMDGATPSLWSGQTGSLLDGVTDDGE